MYISDNLDVHHLSSLLGSCFRHAESAPAKRIRSAWPASKDSHFPSLATSRSTPSSLGDTNDLVLLEEHLGMMSVGEADSKREDSSVWEVPLEEVPSPLPPIQQDSKKLSQRQARSPSKSAKRYKVVY